MQPWYATPGTRCSLPSKSFGSEQEALDYAAEALTTFRHPYAVWWIWHGPGQWSSSHKSEPTHRTLRSYRRMAQG
jgi:hypothetical protein